MTFRRLLALLFAVAMVFAPIGMPAMANASEGHRGMVAAQGHCDRQSPPDNHHKAADKGCCAAMCIAMVVPDGVAQPSQYHADRERPASDQARRGYLGEIATPPPKLA